MDDKKEKSAIGAGTPQAESIENTSDKSITEKREKIKCVFQRPGQISVIMHINDNYFHIRDLIGGVPAMHHIPEIGLEMIFVDNDRFLPRNIRLSDDIIIGGAVMIVKEDCKGKLVSLTTEEVYAARGWLLKHTYEEETK